MTDTTTATGPASLLGCPWPTGIHRFVLGACSRCGDPDPNPPRGITRLPEGFTPADDEPIPYVPTEASADAARMVPEVECQRDGCGQVHQATYSHEGQWDQGPVYAVVCTDGLVDYYTTEGLR